MYRIVLYCSFYGLDIYSLSKSRREVLDYLDKTDRESANLARKFYGCFDWHGRDAEEYASRASLSHSCRENVVKVLKMMLEKRSELIQKDLQDSSSNNGGHKVEDGFYYAKRNAALVKDAENYYRNMFAGGEVTWNIRDSAMVDTLLSLIRFREEWHPGQQQPVKAVVWAHNR